MNFTHYFHFHNLAKKSESLLGTYYAIEPCLILTGILATCSEILEIGRFVWKAANSKRKSNSASDTNIYCITISQFLKCTRNESIIALVPETQNDSVTELVPETQNESVNELVPETKMSRLLS